MNVLHATDPAYPKTCRRAKATADTRILMDQMTEAMRANGGIGLAAPQVGLPLRLIIVEWEGRVFTLLNPEIVQRSKEMRTETEGCLSMPGLTFSVPRHKWVIVQGENSAGTKVRYKANDMLARIFQHEIDHINGVFISSRAEVV